MFLFVFNFVIFVFEILSRVCCLVVIMIIIDIVRSRSLMKLSSVVIRISIILNMVLLVFLFCSELLIILMIVVVIRVIM